MQRNCLNLNIKTKGVSMQLKIKLFSTISAFILTLSCLLIGVFAAQNVSFNIGGNVSFTATSVYAEITGNIKGTAEHPNSNPFNLSPINIDYTDTETEIDLSKENSDWLSLPLNFDSLASPITVTINIDNLAKDRAISVSLTDRTNISGVSIAREYDSSSFSENTFSKTIAGGQTGTFTFTLTLANKNNDISGIFNIDLNLANSNQPSSTYTVDVSVESSFVIPLYVRIDGGEETILNLGDSITLSGNVLSMSITSFAGINSKNLNVGFNKVDFYAPSNPGIYGIYLEGDTSGFPSIYVKDDGLWYSVDEENFYLSDNNRVLNYVLTQDCSIMFGSAEG